jgi:hypothetical protein
VASRNPLTSGFHSGAEDKIPLGCDAISLEELPTFRNAFIFRVKESIPEELNNYVTRLGGRRNFQRKRVKGKVKVKFTLEQATKAQRYPLYRRPGGP